MTLLLFVSFLATVGLTAEDADAPYVSSSSAEAPLRVFEEEGHKGRMANLEPRVIYRGEDIPNDVNTNVSSLILKRGYQVCIATCADGMGPSKVLIAAKRDIRIPMISGQFNNRIQFIRVLPWRNVVKKGHGGKDFHGLNEGWYYLWGGTGKTTEEIQWTPVALKKYQVSQKHIDRFIETKGIQAILGYNEPEGHYKDKQERAVKEMRNLMKTGLRMGGPCLTEAGPRRWLPKFMEFAEAENLRVDFLGCHWYDWKSNPKKNRVDTPQAIFGRFKKYLHWVHSKYNLPIWMTEFNANPYRDNATQIGFLKLALPYLDSLPYVERYAYFQPFGVKRGDTLGAGDTAKMDKTKGSGDFRKVRGDVTTPLTPLGTLWREYASVPAMDQEAYLGSNNLCGDEVEE